MMYTYQTLLWTAILGSSSVVGVNDPPLSRHVLSTTYEPPLAASSTDIYVWSALPIPSSPTSTSTIDMVTFGDGNTLTDSSSTSTSSSSSSSFSVGSLSSWSSYSATGYWNTTRPTTAPSTRQPFTPLPPIQTSTKSFRSSKKHPSSTDVLTSITSSSSCSSLLPGQPLTIWSIVPNTTTVTLTLTGNYTTSIPSTPEFTPPSYCLSTSAAGFRTFSTRPGATTTSGALSSIVFVAPRPTTTIVITSKNAPVVTSIATVPQYGGGGGPTAKQTAVIETSSDPYQWGPIGPPALPTGGSPPIPMTTIYNGDGRAGAPVTQSVDGITVIVAPSSAIIGSLTVPISKGSDVTITEGGDVFTINPSQVIGPNMVIIVPTFTGGNGRALPTTIQGVSVSVGSSSAVVGGTTFAVGSGARPTTVVIQGQTISIGDSGVGFEQTTIAPPANPTPPAVQTTIQGVSVSIGPSSVVIDGTTFAAGPAALQTTVVVKGHTISIGDSGVGFKETTLAVPTITPMPTNVVIVGGDIFSAIGSSIAVIDGQTFTYGPGIATQADTFNGETITIGPAGISFDGTTLGGTAHPSGTVFGVAGGLSITEIGSTLAVVDGTTFTVGPGAQSTTRIIGGQTIIAGPSGIILGAQTLTAPFNPTTQAVTAGSITFSEIGSSLAVIGGSTYTFGPGATPMTRTYNGQTFSIGPGGIGFSQTTFTGVAPTTTSTGKAGKKNDGGRLQPTNGVLGSWVGMMVGLLMLF